MKNEKKFLIPQVEIIDFKCDDIITESDPADFAVVGDSEVPLYGGNQQ